MSSGASGSFKVWSYKNTDDTLETMAASAYFNDVTFRLHDGDIIYVIGSDGSDQLQVTSANGVSPVTVVVYIPASGGAPNDATYLVQIANGSLPNEQAMGALATGIVKNAATTGIQSIAVEGTDYYKPTGTDVAVADGGTGQSTATLAIEALVGGATLTAATVAAGDLCLVKDVDDSNNLKSVTAQSIADLGGGGGGVGSLTYAVITMSASEVNGAYVTPKLLLAAPGANKIIVVSRYMFELKYNSAGYAGGGQGVVQYDSTANGAGQNAVYSNVYANTIKSPVDTLSIGTGKLILSSAMSPSVTINKGIYFSNQTASFTTGNSVCYMHLWYSTVDTTV